MGTNPRNIDGSLVKTDKRALRTEIRNRKCNAIVFYFLFFLLNSKVS